MFLMKRQMETCMSVGLYLEENRKKSSGQSTLARGVNMVAQKYQD